MFIDSREKKCLKLRRERHVWWGKRDAAPGGANYKHAVPTNAQNREAAGVSNQHAMMLNRYVCGAVDAPNSGAKRYKANAAPLVRRRVD